MTQFYWETSHADIWSPYNGPFGTREEALAVGREKCPDCTIETGVRENVTTAQFLSIDIDGMFEQMGENAIDECGESGEEWPDVDLNKKPELKELLENTVIRFFSDNGLDPKFWLITEAQTHKPEAHP